MIKVPAVLLTIAVLVGCAEKRDETPLVVVNERPVTAAEVKDIVLVQAKLLELAGKPVQGDFAAWANRTAMQSLGAIVNARILEDEVGRIGLLPTEEDRQKALAAFNRQAGKAAPTVEALAGEFGELKSAFLRQFESRVKFTAYERVHWRAKLTDEIVRRYLAFRKGAEKRSRQIDAEAHEKAKKAYARLQAGEAWDKVAAECSEDKLVDRSREKFGTVWTTVGEDAWGIKPLVPWLPRLKVGEYTEVLDTRDGLVIVRLVGKEKGGRYRLARILFRMGVRVSVPQEEDFGKYKAELEEKESASRKNASLQQLQKAAKIDYPLGKSFNYEIWKVK